MNWETMYKTPSTGWMRRVRSAPIVTAGFTWHPEIGPRHVDQGCEYQPKGKCRSDDASGEVVGKGEPGEVESLAERQCRYATGDKDKDERSEQFCGQFPEHPNNLSLTRSELASWCPEADLEISWVIGVRP